MSFQKTPVKYRSRKRAGAKSSTSDRVVDARAVGLDPLTAGLNLMTVVSEIVLEGLRGATPAQREKLMQWYLDDRERIRRWLKLEDVNKE